MGPIYFALKVPHLKNKKEKTTVIFGHFKLKIVCVPILVGYNEMVCVSI